MDLNRVLNIQNYIHDYWPDLQSAFTITISQQAEIELIASAVDFTDPYQGVWEAVDNIVGDRILPHQVALMTIGIIETDRVYMEANAK